MLSELTPLHLMHRSVQQRLNLGAAKKLDYTSRHVDDDGKSARTSDFRSRPEKLNVLHWPFEGLPYYSSPYTMNTSVQ